MTTHLFHKIEGDNGPWLLIIHGLFGSSDNWQTLSKRWSESMRVLSIDVRNHGRSFHHDQMTYEAICNDIISLLDYLDIDSIHVLGHSMGGKIAMHLAAWYTTYVASLIIVDIAPYSYPPHHQRVFEILDSLDLAKYSNRKDIETQMLRLLSDDPSTAQFLLKNIKRNSQTHQFEYKFNLPVLKSHYSYIIESLPPRGFSGHVTFLAGQSSLYISTSTSIHLFDLYPAATIEVVPNAGHWLHADNPDVTHTLVLNHIFNT